MSKLYISLKIIINNYYFNYISLLYTVSWGRNNKLYNPLSFKIVYFKFFLSVSHKIKKKLSKNFVVPIWICSLINNNKHNVLKKFTIKKIIT